MKLETIGMLTVHPYATSTSILTYLPHPTLPSNKITWKLPHIHSNMPRKRTVSAIYKSERTQEQKGVDKAKSRRLANRRYQRK